MRVLVISLLRPGDLLMHAWGVRELQLRWPNARLTLVANPESRGLRQLPDFENMDWIEFPRAALQGMIANKSVSPFEAFKMLDTWIEGHQLSQFDLVVNLTQNRLSGFLSGILGSPHYLGLRLDANGVPTFGNIDGFEYFRQLNRKPAESAHLPRHWVDWVRLGCAGANAPRARWLPRGLSAEKSERRIAIQVSSADPKKVWPLASWAAMLKRVHQQEPTLVFDLMLAPHEMAVLSSWYENLRRDGIAINMVASTFKEAYDHLKSSDVLITVDTSIKHLASLASCPIVELALGGSDIHFTGAYGAGNRILTPQTQCFPCEHRKACHQPTLLCGEDLDPHAVAEMLIDFVTRRSSKPMIVTRPVAQASKVKCWWTDIRAADSLWQLASAPVDYGTNQTFKENSGAAEVEL